MMYGITYILKEVTFLKVSPHSGKPYKRPKRIHLWVTLFEKLPADNLPDALEKARARAEERKWELEKVEEL